MSLVEVAGAHDQLRREAESLRAAQDEATALREALDSQGRQGAADAAAAKRLQSELLVAITDTGSARDELEAVQAELSRVQQQVILHVHPLTDDAFAGLTGRPWEPSS
jgi:hypothetical protein